MYKAMNVNKPYSAQLIRSVLILLLLFGAMVAGIRIEDRFRSDNVSARFFQKAFTEIESDGYNYLEQLVGLFSESQTKLKLSDEVSAIKPDNATLFMYKNDSLWYWSDNSIELNEEQSKEVEDGDFIKLKNGHYFFQIKENQTFKFILASHIHASFPYENNFVRNGFASVFPQNWEFDLKGEAGELFPIKQIKGNTIFHIKPSGKQTSGEVFYFLLLLSGSALLLVLYRIVFISCWVFLRPVVASWWFVLFLVFIFFIRYLVMFSRVPEVIFRDEFFSAALLSAGDLIPSLGDLWLHALTAIYAAYRFYKIDSYVIRQWNTLKNAIVFGLAMALGLIAVSWFYLLLMEVTIVNSTIPLSFKELYNFNLLTYITFLIISLISVAYILTVVGLLKLIRQAAFLRNSIVVVLLVFVSILIVLLLNQYQLYSWTLIVILGVLILLLWPFTGDRIFKANAGTTFLLLSFSAILALVFYNSNKENADKVQNLLAYRIAEESDPLLEYLYSEVKEKMISDTVLLQLVYKHDTANQFLEEDIFQYIHNNYLFGYFNKFNTNLVLCKPDEVLFIRPGDYYIGCSEYFSMLMNGNQSSKPTDVEGLYLINDYLQQTYYLAKIDIYDHNNNLGKAVATLYLEFYNRFLPEGIGYPELLIDERNDRSKELSAYSFARYVNGLLAYKFGSYMYSNKLEFQSNDNSWFFEHDDFRHLYYRVNDEVILLISRKSKSLVDVVAPFSYFVVFIGLLLFAILFVAGLGRYSLSKSINFRIKFQILLVSSLVLSFITIATVSYKYIQSFYQSRTNEVLKEKTQSILIELEHKLKGSDFKAQDIEPYLYQLLTKFSAVFFTDINLYDLKGRLMASSRPEIFEKGLISELMNREAYEQLSLDGKIYYIHQEKIGSGKYLSSYIPFRNEEGVPVAFLNLPYFAKETELREEISSFLLTFLNILFMLTGLSAWLALVLSRRMTRPLLMIQEKMQSLSLGRPNEKIGYAHADEIGQLVRQYNQLIDQLEESAVMLARSERESAWSEMARQVAHEIKNPLTPMRLSVQYLQKSWNEGDPDIGDKINKTTQTMVEQIDALTEIASAFADFARMPVQKTENVSVTEVINQVIDLFSMNQNAEIVWLKPNKELYVTVDRNSLLRVFNNLIKNALQALEGISQGKVEIEMTEDGNSVVVKISDNGKGMTVEQSQRVFTPYFTTKTSGTGIGLSIVNNIIRAMQGEISFETETGKGTTFTLRLPKSVL
jgi:two-component system, NtrC family, nitrogen regulation sensor histidine kinase NtrY